MKAALSRLAVPSTIVVVTLGLDAVSGVFGSTKALAVEIAALASFGTALDLAWLEEAPRLRGPLVCVSLALALSGSFLFRFVPPRSLDVYSLLGFASLCAVATIAMASTIASGRRERRWLLRFGATTLVFAGAFAGLEAL